MSAVAFEAVGELEPFYDAYVYDIPEDRQQTLKVITRFRHDTFAGVLAADDQGAVLAWWDYVVNSWAEYFDNVPTGILRLAVLIESAKDDGWFTLHGKTFEDVARGFFAANLEQ